MADMATNKSTGNGGGGHQHQATSAISISTSAAADTAIPMYRPPHRRINDNDIQAGAPDPDPYRTRRHTVVQDQAVVHLCHRRTFRCSYSSLYFPNWTQERPFNQCCRLPKCHHPTTTKPLQLTVNPCPHLPSILPIISIPTTNVINYNVTR